MSIYSIWGYAGSGQLCLHNQGPHQDNEAVMKRMGRGGSRMGRGRSRLCRESPNLTGDCPGSGSSGHRLTWKQLVPGLKSREIAGSQLLDKGEKRKRKKPNWVISGHSPLWYLQSGNEHPSAASAQGTIIIIILPPFPCKSPGVLGFLLGLQLPHQEHPLLFPVCCTPCGIIISATPHWAQFSL